MKSRLLYFILTTFCFFILACGGGGGSSPKTTPEAPQNVVAIGGNGQISLSWEKVVGATTYNIYWSMIAGVTQQSGTKVSSITTPYIHAGLTNGLTYYYVVSSVNEHGEGPVSLEVSTTPQQSSPYAPFAPSGVTATAGDGQAAISWTAVPAAISYNLYWSMSSDISSTNGTKITNVTSPYTHEGLSRGSTYYYVVTAVNSYGESEDSEKTSAIILNNTLQDVCVAMGDSITVGKGVGYDGSYVYLLSVDWGKQVYNRGINGAISADGAYWIDDILDRYNPQYITIFYGTNDIGLYPADWTIDNLRYIIERAKANGTKPVIATLTPVFGPWSWLKPYNIILNQKIRQLASEEGITVADLEDSFNWNSDYILEDGLHPNIAGHAIITRTFLRALTD